VTGLIAAASVLAYAALALLTARWRYQAIRPYTEPVRCKHPDLHARRGDHSSGCYARNDSTVIDSRPEATVAALLTGLVWPLIGPALLVQYLVTAGGRPLPAESEAKIRRLLAENERLRRQQEGVVRDD
jgi:hypothetical protein